MLAFDVLVNRAEVPVIFVALVEGEGVVLVVLDVDQTIYQRLPIGVVGGEAAWFLRHCGIVSSSWRSDGSGQAIGGCIVKGTGCFLMYLWLGDGLGLTSVCALQQSESRKVAVGSRCELFSIANFGPTNQPHLFVLRWKLPCTMVGFAPLM